MSREEELRTLEARASRGRQCAAPLKGADRRAVGGEAGRGRRAACECSQSSVPPGQCRPEPPLGAGREASGARGSSARARARVRRRRRQYVPAAGARPGRAHKGDPFPGAPPPARQPRPRHQGEGSPASRSRLPGFQAPRSLAPSCPSFIYFGGRKRGHLSWSSKSFQEVCTY